MLIGFSIVGFQRYLTMLVSLIYIRRSTPSTILTIPKPVSEFTYVTFSSSLTSTIHSPVPTHSSTNHVIKEMCRYCDTFALGHTMYRYELIRSQLSTNISMSPRASEGGLSYTHWVCYGLTIAANNRFLNLTTLYWSLIYSNLQLCYFGIYWMESMLCHSGHINPKPDSPSPKSCSWNTGSFVWFHSVNSALIYFLIVTNISLKWLYISRDAMLVW